MEGRIREQAIPCSNACLGQLHADAFGGEDKSESSVLRRLRRDGQQAVQQLHHGSLHVRRTPAILQLFFSSALSCAEIRFGLGQRMPCMGQLHNCSVFYFGLTQVQRSGSGSQQSMPCMGQLHNCTVFYFGLTQVRRGSLNLCCGNVPLMQAAEQQ